MSFKAAISSITAQYDKLLAGAMVALLLGSAIYLGLRLHGVASEEENTRQALDRMKPAHPDAVAADLGSYNEAKSRLAEPVQIGGWTNSLLVPETRVWCVDCRLPIEITAEVCPFCKTRQPEPPKEPDDKDQDGMLDKWELDHGLNPADRADAARDPDNDGFTNLEEFLADPPTDPRDADDHPSYADKLCVQRIVANPFRLLFKSVLTMPDGSLKFAINDQNTNKTYFKALGDDVEGFELFKFQERFEEETSGGITRQANRSILTLKREKKLIPLTMGKRVSYVELTCELVFKPDGSKYTLKVGEGMDLKGKAYRVLRIDSERGSVVIEQLSDSKRLVIVPCNGRAK